MIVISDETRKKWDDKIETIMGSYENCCVELTDWEIQFMDLSHKQSKVLNRIYEKG